MDLAIKDKQIQAIKLFETTKFQSKIIYNLNDKHISDFELLVNLGPLSYIITLKFSRKHKRDDFGIYNDTILISKILEKIIRTLV